MANFPPLQAVAEDYDLYMENSGDEGMTRKRFATETPEARAVRLWDNDWSSFPGREQEDVDYVVRCETHLESLDAGPDCH